MIQADRSLDFVLLMFAYWPKLPYQAIEPVNLEACATISRSSKV